uniref:RNA-binding protein 28 n=1 Tax=Lepisosteus oculatus TaxID=7918 RepID=W5NES1_LEPOC
MANSTLFVRNLPTSACSDRLEEIFSEVGPVKHCFVVKEKGGETCRGFGYVTFSMEEDAQKAMKEIKQYDGQQIVLMLAKKKQHNKKKSVIKVNTSSTSTEPGPKKQKPKSTKKSKKKARLIIRNLSFKCTEDDLKQFFSKYGAVLEVNIPRKADGKMRGFAFVQFKNVLEAGKALKATNLKEIKDLTNISDWPIFTSVLLLETPASSLVPSEIRTTKNKTKGKLITRGKRNQDIMNASAVKIESNNEKDLFASGQDNVYEDIHLPERKIKGPFMEIMYNKMCYMTVLHWWIMKNTQTCLIWFLALNQYLQNKTNRFKIEEYVKRTGDFKHNRTQLDKRPGKKAPVETEECEIDDDTESSDEHSAAEDHEEENDAESEEADSDGSDSGSEDEEDNEIPAQKKHHTSDVNEGKTVFIRNLSFDTEEDGLEELLLQYGELKYVRIVLHPDTEHSKGCAFAQFKTKEAAEKCIAAAEEGSESGGLRLDGRKLNIVLAISREEAMKVKTQKVKTHTGTRNLFLAREGLIRAGTAAAEGLSAADLAKRARFEELKRLKLRDINVFVSKTRLCVHNLPKSVDQKHLRKLCLKAAGGGKDVRINECRVMYDRKPQLGKTVGRSLGYGFVQFQEHDHALKALRHLNNNPDIFGPQKRPIVEFSLEDSRKLKIKENRAQKSKQNVAKAGENNKSKKSSKVLECGQKREQDHSESTSSRLSDIVDVGEKKSGHWSGFQTKPEVEKVELEDGKKRRKILDLPSHRGPKIRKRDKGKQQQVQPKKVRDQPSRKERIKSVFIEKQSQQRNQTSKKMKNTFRRKEDDRFDSLVEKYKKTILGNPKSSIVKKGKWFIS